LTLKKCRCCLYHSDCLITKCLLILIYYLLKIAVAKDAKNNIKDRAERTIWKVLSRSGAGNASYSIKSFKNWMYGSNKVTRAIRIWRTIKTISINQTMKSGKYSTNNENITDVANANPNTMRIRDQLVNKSVTFLVTQFWLNKSLAS